MDTGFTSQDAQSDFNRSAGGGARAPERPPARAGGTSHPLRSRRWSRRSGGPASGGSGCRRSALDTIVGSVDRTTEFDRDFRPRSGRVRVALAADQRGAASGQGDAADQRLPGRRPALRRGRASPRLGRPPPRPRRDRGLRHRGVTRVSPSEGLTALRPAGEEPRAAVPRARAARPRAARADQLRRSRGRLRRAGRDGRGLGLPADPGAGRAARPPRDRASLVQRRVRSRWSRTCARPT